MKKQLFIFMFFMSFSFASFSQESTPHTVVIDGMDNLTAVCYAKSMIGYDSVINSRVGLEPELSIHITQNNPLKPKHPLSKTNLLITIMDAYLWKGPAHSYAVVTFSKCIQETDLKEIE